MDSNGFWTNIENRGIVKTKEQMDKDAKAFWEKEDTFGNKIEMKILTQKEKEELINI